MSQRSTLQVEGFFDPATWTISDLVLGTDSRQCALIDSVLDYDPQSGRTSNASAKRLIARVHDLGASVQWILATHVHADLHDLRRQRHAADRRLWATLNKSRAGAVSLVLGGLRPCKSSP